MIQIEKKREGGRIVLDVRGHAGYAEMGKDIVCAACSTLICTLLGQMQRLEDREEAVLCENIQEAGHCRMALELCSPEAKASYDTIMTGFQMLADSYPDYVSINCKIF